MSGTLYPRGAQDVTGVETVVQETDSVHEFRFTLKPGADVEAVRETLEAGGWTIQSSFENEIIEQQILVAEEPLTPF